MKPHKSNALNFLCPYRIPKTGTRQQFYKDGLPVTDLSKSNLKKNRFQFCEAKIGSEDDAKKKARASITARYSALSSVWGLGPKKSPILVSTKESQIAHICSIVQV